MASRMCGAHYWNGVDGPGQVTYGPCTYTDSRHKCQHRDPYGNCWSGTTEAVTVKVTHEFPTALHVHVYGAKSARQAAACANVYVRGYLGYNPGHYVSSGAGSDGQHFESFVFSRKDDGKIPPHEHNFSGIEGIPGRVMGGGWIEGYQRRTCACGAHKSM